MSNSTHATVTSPSVSHGAYVRHWALADIRRHQQSRVPIKVQAVHIAKRRLLRQELQPECVIRCFATTALFVSHFGAQSALCRRGEVKRRFAVAVAATVAQVSTASEQCPNDLRVLLLRSGTRLTARLVTNGTVVGNPVTECKAVDTCVIKLRASETERRHKISQQRGKLYGGVVYLSDWRRRKRER